MRKIFILVAMQAGLVASVAQAADNEVALTIKNCGRCWWYILKLASDAVSHLHVEWCHLNAARYTDVALIVIKQFEVVSLRRDLSFDGNNHLLIRAQV